MKYHEMRFEIPKDIFKRYKIICTKLDLSIPKQTAAIIENFVKVQEENNEKIEKSKEKKP